MRTILFGVLSGATKCAVNGYTFCRFRATMCAGATKCAVTRPQIALHTSVSFKLE